MADRREFLQSLAATGALSTAPPMAALLQSPNGLDERRYWVEVLQRIAKPVLTNLAERKLKARMPVESHPRAKDRAKFTHLEAIGRLLAGIAPWLELNGLQGPEEKLRSEYASLARQAIDAATDPASPDFLNFHDGQQPLVDAAFLAHAILRAPDELWKKLEAKTQKNLVAALKSARRIRPGFNNWLLFAAMVEAVLCARGEDWDVMRVDYAIRQHEQ
jgi:hypothetical protein